MAEFEFDANDVPPAEVFELLPAGRYGAMIVESEKKPTKNNDGERIVLTWQIIEGEHEGRKIFQGLNIDNPNEKAVAIAKRELSAISHATGKIRIRDTEELHDIPCVIVLKVVPAKGDFDAKNEIKGVEGLDAKAATPTKQAPVKPVAQAATTPAKKAAGKMPWQK